MTLTEFVNRNRGQIKKYKKFIESNDWVVDKLTNLEQPLSCIKTATERFNLQNSIIRGIVDRLKYFVKTYEGQWGKKSYKEFLHLCVDTIDLHLFRAEDYITEFDLSAYKQPKEQEEEIELQNHIFVSTSSIREVLSGINLTDGEDSSEIEFYKDQYAPLIMHEQIVNLYPSIQKKLDDLGIDFNRKPEPTFHILNTNPPVWDTNKNYFDQEPETLQYYIDEWNKIKNGIKVDGVYLTGWTYYQINFFVAKHPSIVVNPISGKEENKDIIGVPPYRDTEWLLIQEEFERATERKEMVFIAASRRVGKTTMEASRLSYAKVIGRKAMLVVSGSKKDIGQLEDAVTIANENIHPAFRSYTIVNDWEVVVEIGVRLKSGKKVVANKMKIVNLDRGTGKKSEDLAGFTPDEAVIDEIMKLPFKTHLEALRPALNSPSGLRCTVILAGTGGNEELSKDAFDMLMEPEKYGFLPMDWDKFNSRVPKEHRTWKERPFGIFVPAQMGAIDGAIKVKMPLSEYLGVKSKTLSKIYIMVTDWESATKAVYDYRGKVSDDIESYTKRVIYYPACPSDMLLSGRINSFPVNEAKMHLEYLKTSGGRGKKVFLYEKDDGSISYSMTENETPKFPHKGGYVDGPVMLYEDLPEDTPPDYLYTGGLDDYKQDEADTDSVGSFVIYKRDYLSDDPFSGKVVATIATRPDPHGKFHQQIYLLQRAFNAVCFMENADTGYVTYLQDLRVDSLWLQPAIDFSGDIVTQNNSRRKYGWNPSHKPNRDALDSRLITYTKRKVKKQTTDGEFTTILGVQNIDDVGILEEICAYDGVRNVDRLTAFKSALGLDFYYHVNKLFPDETRQKDQHRVREEDRLRVRKKRSFFGSSNNKRKNFW